MKSTYVRFLQLLHSIDSDLDWQIDAVSRYLLDVITIHHSKNEPLTVSAAMKLNSIASPATIHRKISTLWELDLVVYEFKDGNRRTKYLAPTDLAIQRYEKLGKVMLELKKA